MTSRGRLLVDLALKVNSDRKSNEKAVTEPKEVRDNETNLKSEVEFDEMIITEEICNETKLKGKSFIDFHIFDYKTQSCF